MSAAELVTASYGTSTVKRERRTKVELGDLDNALLRMVESFRPATIRGTFYQAEVTGLVPKDEKKGYRVVQRRLAALRRSGRLDYAAIVDNIRWVHGHNRYNGPADFARSVAWLYRRDYWARSAVRVEVWIEKDALAAVIEPTVVEEWGLDLYVSRGFASMTYIEEAAVQARQDGRPLFVFILSDHDPAGIALSHQVERDLPERAKPVEVVVERIAVTPDQIRLFGLPTRKTKMTDSRARKFVDLYGDTSAELDAIRPDLLRQLVSDAIEPLANRHEIEEMKLIEASERRGIMDLAERFR
jgi:hypothetical protein